MEIEWMICLAFMAICAGIDIRKKEIPVVVLALFGGGAFLYTMIWDGKAWNEIFYSLVPGLCLLLLSFCTRESIGYGDGLAAMAAGILIGWRGCVTAIIGGFLFSAVFSLALLVCRKAKGRSRIPFLPFLTAGLGVFYVVWQGV